MINATISHFPDYPVTRAQIAVFIPAVADDKVWKFVQGSIKSEEDRMSGTVVSFKQVRQTAQRAAVSVVNWFIEAPEADFPTIEKYGILHFITCYCSSKVEIVLLRAKLDGKNYSL